MEAIKVASQCGVLSLELIESYDDTGLYYFLIEDYRKSAYYQLVATALSEIDSEDTRKTVLYKKRLGWAVNKYSVDIGRINNQCDATELACYNFLGVLTEFALYKNILSSSSKCLHRD